VNSRYRLPLWVPAAVLAGGGADATARWVGMRQWRRVATAGAGFAGLALISLVNWWGLDPTDRARDYFYRSVANLERGRAAAAVTDARLSVEHDSRYVDAWMQLGNARVAAGDLEAARIAYLEAGRRRPEEARIWNNLGVVEQQLGRYGYAYRHFRRAARLQPDHAGALLNAALLELRAGMTAAAAEKITAAVQLAGDDVRLFCARWFLARARGRHEAASGFRRKAMAADSGLARQLEAESRAPIPAEVLVSRPLDE
jgi:tetratricopeptide (TPR) repeat protein